MTYYCEEVSLGNLLEQEFPNLIHLDEKTCTNGPITIRKTKLSELVVTVDISSVFSSKTRVILSLLMDALQPFTISETKTVIKALFVDRKDLNSLIEKKVTVPYCFINV